MSRTRSPLLTRIGVAAAACLLTITGGAFASNVSELMALGTPAATATKIDDIYVDLASTETITGTKTFTAATVTTLTTTTGTITALTTNGIQGGDSNLTVAATVAGAAVTISGGDSSTGTAGAVSMTGGAGITSGNRQGGAASVTGGAGLGTAAGGASGLTGGAGGATGAGGAITVTGGAGGATSGDGGSITLTGGAVTSGTAGGIILRSITLVPQGAPTAKTTSATLTAAEVLAGIITVNQGAAGTSAQQLPTAAALDTALPYAAAGDAYDFSVINISTNAAEDASLTTNTGWTLVGSMDVESDDNDRARSSGGFRARKTGAAAWTLYRLN